MRAVLALCFAVLLAGCGFHLRGTMSGNLPYKSLYIALPENSEIALWMKRYLASSETRLVDNPKEAEAIFQQLYDNHEKAILSVNNSGQVKEYRLQSRYGFRIVNAKGKELLAPMEVTLLRDMTYDASAVLAKEYEEATLWRDMSMDIAMQVLRRLAIAKPKDPNAESDD